MSAARDNSGKPQLSFILQFPTAVAAFARVKELGAIKYERDNWKKGGKPDWEYLDAALRHISAFMEGETFAQDTGCTHLAHAMWNIMALQDLNYPGVVYDKFVFDAMAEYWETRRAAEAQGETFDTTPEEFLELRKKEERVKKVLNFQEDTERRVAGMTRLDRTILDKVDEFRNNKRGGPFDPESLKAPGPAPEGWVEDVTAQAAQKIIDNVADDELEFPVPDDDFGEFIKASLRKGEEASQYDFEKPLTANSGDSIVLNARERTASVINAEGDMTDWTNLIEVNPGETITVIAPDEIALGPFEVGNLDGVRIWDDDGKETPEFQEMLGTARQEAAEGLAAVMGCSVEDALRDIKTAENAFTIFSDASPLENLFAGNITTTLEAPMAEIVGKTDRPVEELREEARRNIEAYTREKAAENAALDEVLRSRGFRDYLANKVATAKNEGRKEGRETGFQEGRHAAVEEIKKTFGIVDLTDVDDDSHYCGCEYCE